MTTEPPLNWAMICLARLPLPIYTKAMNLESEEFFIGTVMLVLHYCMGRVTITPQGEVLSENKNIIPGLHAVGKVTGGVHSSNQLGSNSLLECAMFGSIVGQAIPIHAIMGDAVTLE